MLPLLGHSRLLFALFGRLRLFGRLKDLIVFELAEAKGNGIGGEIYRFWHVFSCGDSRRIQLEWRQSCRRSWGLSSAWLAFEYLKEAVLGGHLELYHRGGINYLNEQEMIVSETTLWLYKVFVYRIRLPHSLAHFWEREPGIGNGQADKHTSHSCW